MQTWGFFSKLVMLWPKERSQKAMCSSSNTNVLPRKLTSGKPSSDVVAQTQYFFSSNALSTRCFISSVILITGGFLLNVQKSIETIQRGGIIDKYIVSDRGIGSEGGE